MQLALSASALIAAATAQDCSPFDPQGWSFVESTGAWFKLNTAAAEGKTNFANHNGCRTLQFNSTVAKILNQDEHDAISLLDGLEPTGSWIAAKCYPDLYNNDVSWRYHEASGVPCQTFRLAWENFVYEDPAGLFENPFSLTYHPHAQEGYKDPSWEGVCQPGSQNTQYLKNLHNCDYMWETMKDVNYRINSNGEWVRGHFRKIRFCEFLDGFCGFPSVIFLTVTSGFAIVVR